MQEPSIDEDASGLTAMLLAESEQAILTDANGEPESFSTFHSNSSTGSLDVNKPGTPMDGELLPPLPMVDYMRRLQQSPMTNWPALEAGVEVEEEGELAWPIEDWFKLAAFESVTSPDFIELGGFKWSVILMPQGTQEVRNRGVSLFIKASPLNPLDTDWHVCARIMIIMRRITSSGDLVELRKNSSHRFEPSEADWGFTSFVTPRAMLNGDTSTGGRPLLERDDQAGGGRLEIVGKIQIIRDATGMLWHNFINYDSKKSTGFVGLLNQGATCYMNSLLQSLFLTNLLRKATYRIATEGDRATESIALALQRTFYRLQTSNSPVGTTELTRSFGWDTMDAFMQHDVHEFNRVLLDELETKMKGSPAEGMVQKLFTGRIKNVRKCLNVDFESVREEDFYDVQLTIRGMKSLAESFAAYVAPTFLTGDNKYQTEEHGYQDAKMFAIFERLPPVLHLHLERYTFDPYTGNTIKINDRFAFPTQINLDDYLSETADLSVPQDYRLHSVLVHGGDSHGGHYCAFIQYKGKWFKFDDTKVVPVTEKEAVEDNYGVEEDSSFNLAGVDEPIRLPPSYTRQQRARRITNAYMLVYIRESDWEEVMGEVDESDIPAHIINGVKADAEAEERRRAEKLEMLNALHVSLFSDDLLRNYNGGDVFNVTNRAQPMAQYESFRVRKSDTVGEFAKNVNEDMRLEQEELRFWTFASRRNHTVRLDAPLLNPETCLGQLIGTGNRYAGQLNLFLEKTDESQSLFSEPPSLDRILSGELRLVLFKYFERGTQTLINLGHRMVDGEWSVGEAATRLLDSCNLPIDQNFLELFEEIKMTRLEAVPYETLFTEAKIGTGDIVILQAVGAEDEASVREYYEGLAQRILVAFQLLGEDSRKRSSEDVPSSSEEQRSIQLFASFDMPLGELIDEAARGFNCDPAYVRLHVQDPRTERYWALQNAAPSMSLSEVLTKACSVVFPSGCSEFSFGVERLSMSLEELDTMKPLQIVLPSGEMLRVHVPFDATLADLLERLPKEKLSSLRQYRLAEVQSHRIHRDLGLDDLLTTFPADCECHLLPIPSDADQEKDKLVSVAFYWREVARGHGSPALFAAKEGESWSSAKERLVAQLGLKPDTAISAVSYGLPRPIADEEIIYDRLTVLPGTRRVASSDYLGIEQQPVGSDSPAVQARSSEKGIRIRSNTPRAQS